MATIVIKTIKPSGGDYTSLSAWEAGEQRDLVTLNEIAVAECYSMSDTTAVAINGFTTDATHYIEIRTPTSERHNGKWDATKYRLEVTDATAIDCQDDHVRIFGLQIKAIAPTSSRDNVSFHFMGTPSEIQFAYNIVDGGGSTLRNGIWCTGDVFKVWNNVIYGHKKSWNANLYIGACSTSSYFYNNTLYDGDYNVKTNTANAILKNNLSAAPARSGYNGTFNSASDYNASDDATSTGGANDRVSQTFTFVDAVNRDLHLAATDTGARDFGADLSATFTDDIEGQLRTAPWDIGADEYVAGGGGTALLKIIAETAQVSDGYIRRMAMTRPVSETESLPEGIQRRGLLRRIIAETASLTEGLLRRGALNRLIGESESVSESIVRRGTLRRIITETQNLTETAAKSISTLLVKVVNESVQMAGAITRRLGLTRTASEGVSISENTARRGNLRRILSETVNITEDIIRSRFLVRIATETMSLVETALKRAGLVRVVSEAMSVAEAALKYLGIVKVVNEGLSLIEGLVKKLGLDTLGVLGENLTIVVRSVARGIKSMTSQRGIISKTPKREVKP